jgi:hypothetical protein
LSPGLKSEREKLMNDRHLTALRNATAIPRQAKADLDAVLVSLENERTLLPERLWRSAVDDDMIEAEVLMDEILRHVDDALESAAEMTGEDEPFEEAARPRPAPLPEVRPTDAEVDDQRRAAARALRNRGIGGA